MLPTTHVIKFITLRKTLKIYILNIVNEKHYSVYNVHIYLHTYYTYIYTFKELLIVPK